jgi:hypothetical protein
MSQVYVSMAFITGPRTVSLAEPVTGTLPAYGRLSRQSRCRVSATPAR